MSAKQNILAKLRKSLTGATPIADDFDVDLVTQPYTYSAEQRIPQLRKLMEAVHTEIHLTSGEGWPALLAQLLRGEIRLREDDQRCTLFKSVGTALEDRAAAMLACGITPGDGTNRPVG